MRESRVTALLNRRKAAKESRTNAAGHVDTVYIQ